MAEETVTEPTTPSTSEETVKTPGAVVPGVVTPTQPATEAASGDAKFTQADIDRIVSQRLAEEKAKLDKAAREKKAKEEGDYQTLLTTKETELETERARNKALALKYKAVTVAQVLNIEKPEVALRLIDQDAVEYGADGEPTNLEKLFKAAIEELPALVKADASAQGSTGHTPGGSAGTIDVNSYINRRWGKARPQGNVQKQQ
jgi:hypothetical protein